MLPHRRLSEVLIFAKVSKKHQLLVEGPTDQVIIKSFCEGEGLQVLIYPITAVEIDCCEVNADGGNKGRLIRVSEFLGRSKVARVLCIVDRDDMDVNNFLLNSHCITTDFSCLDMYALDIEEFRSFFNRAFLANMSSEEFESVLGTARLASIVLWEKERVLGGVALANLRKSLKVRDRKVVLDMDNWLSRSRNSGEAGRWDLLAKKVRARQAVLPADFRFTMSVHFLSEVLQFWTGATKRITLFPTWVENHLRGSASHSVLKGFEFFEELARRCAVEAA
jgi:hypothetical protein